MNHPRLSRAPQELEQEVFDVLVLGGGITGAGIARHAAQAGLRTALVEAADFGSGTSSRSTKLIHGGLRYLAMGDFALVREAALERKAVHRIAPHLAEPRWMVLPVRSRLEWLKYRVGVGIYEFLGSVAASDRFGQRPDGSAAQLEPGIAWNEFPYACVYREYLTDDARLVLATLRSAVALGAVVQNYVRAEAVIPPQAGQEFHQVQLSDALQPDSTFTARARTVINATGPWAESLLPPSTDAARLRLSKGVHIVLRNEQLPVNNLVMIGAPDGRLLFVIGRGRYTYVGTTDTPYDRAPRTWPTVSAADVEYLLAPLATYFPKHPISAEDVVASWAGLRPLVNEPGKAPKEMSRKDEIWQDDGFITIAGGKLTGFRKMAEDVLERVGAHLQRSVALGSKLQPLCGGDLESTGCRTVEELITHVARRYQQPEVIAARLVRLYGSEVESVLGAAPTPLSASLFAEEVDWGVVTEGAISLEDMVYLRLRAAWFAPMELLEALPAIAARMATLRGWSETVLAQQLSQCRERLRSDLEFGTADSAG
ncbi:MAG: glycerol-3-phosphate dehydrogenase/oxidase [Pseudomonadales bacterium]